MSVQQKALWLVAKQGSFEVGPKDISKPGPGELLIKIHATAINPVDWKIHTYGVFVTEFPAVLGTDSAGTVEEVGEGVQGFAKGDRVIHQGYFNNTLATFQQYSLIAAEYVAKLPESISFDEGASIPVALAAATIGLYNTNEGTGIDLVAPWKEGGRGKYSGKPIFISGGSTSVGLYVIQFAKLSGFSPIISTSSPSNADLVTSYGATHVLDRSLSPASLAAEVAKIIGSAPLEVAYDSVGSADTQQAAYDLLVPGGRFLSTLPQAFKVAEGKNITAVNVFGTVHVQKAFGVDLYAHLTPLLADGSIKPNKVEVLPGGLAGIPDGFERLKANKVSAVKLVVRPQETA